MKNRSKLAVMVMLATVVTAATALGSAPEREKTATAFISGKVSDDSGSPVPGAGVEAFSCAEDLPAGSAIADAGGNYRLGPIADGCYRLRFDHPRYESSWHGDPGLRETATELEVQGEITSGIDGSLSPAGATIGGTVKGSDGKPLAGAWVTTIRQTEEDLFFSDARTDAKGKYAVQVSPGRNLVLFTKRGHVTRIHGKSLMEPTMVDAAEGKKVSGIDAILTRGGSIAGSVTNTAGEPLNGIYVVANGTGGADMPHSARTDRSGRFLLDGLPTGSYRLLVADEENRYILQWYGGTSDPDEAQPIAVTAPAAITGVRVELKTAGGISGRITDQAGNPISGAMVLARSSDKRSIGGNAMTGETGEYTISGLSSGSYLVAFSTRGGASLPRLYKDASEESAATPVEVAAPQVTYGIDQVLPEGTMVSGTVRNAGGEPLPGVIITAYPAGKEGRPSGFAYTGADGTFSVPLAEGDYLLNFTATGGYLSQWSGGRATRAEARPVTVNKEKGAEKQDVVLVRGGGIAGTVRSRTGAGIAGIQVSARDAVTGESAESATTDQSGSYQITGLRSGAYRLTAEGSQSGYIRESLPQPAEARPPVVTEGIDIVMRAGGAVSGRVTGRDGGVLGGITVTAHDPTTWDDIATASTDDNGTYTLGGLPEGRYRIKFDGGDSRYAVQWYRGKARREESLAVDVTGTGTVTGIDATLQTGIPLAGTVTDAAGVPLENAEIEVYGRTEDEPFDTARTDRTGRFVVPSLAPGSYRVRFSHGSHVPRWFGGSDRRTAAPLTVEAGMAPVTMPLQKGAGKINGKLRNPQGQQIGQAWITAIEPATGVAVADERICECSGEFHTPVPAASYLLRVERHGQVTWFGGPTREEAVPVPVHGDVGGLDMVIDDEKVRTSTRGAGGA